MTEKLFTTGTLGSNMYYFYPKGFIDLSKLERVDIREDYLTFDNIVEKAEEEQEKLDRLALSRRSGKGRYHHREGIKQPPNKNGRGYLTHF
jgi:hypothetical protein